MDNLNREDLLKLARLARLELTEDELTEFSQELSAILHYVEQLQSVDISGLQPTNQVTGLVNVTREDTIYDYGYTADQLLENVPSVQDRQIKVKRMLG